MNPLQRVVAVVGLLGLLGLAAWLNSTIRRNPAPPPNTTQRAISLDAARQKDIWRAEHTTFEIEQRFGPAFRGMRSMCCGILQKWLNIPKKSSP